MLRGADEEAAQEGGQTTSTSRVSFEDKTLRACAASACALSVVLLGDLRNKRMVQIIVGASSHLMRWQQEQAQELRSAKAACDWVFRQTRGGVLKHVREGLEFLSSERALSECGFVVPESPASSAIDNLESGVEDDFADLFGQFSLCLAFARVRRLLWLVAGWPSRMSRILSTKLDEVEGVVVVFRADWEIHEQLKSLPDQSRADQNVLSRHLLALTCNRQLMLGLKSNDWEATDELKELVRNRQSGMVSSQAVEDCFGE